MLTFILLWLLGTGDSYDAIRRELTSRYPDWMRASDDPKFPKVLNRAWTIIGDHSAAYLTSHPHATASEVAAAIKQLNGSRKADDYQLDASAIPLGESAYVVSAEYPWSGTFFVVARDEAGRFRVRWNIKDLAARHYKRRDEIGAWAWIGFPWGGGPLVGSVAPLPPSRAGHPRFYVDAHAAALAGGTWSNQISIWEWNGRAAVPRFVRPYLVSFDTHPNKLTGDTLTIPTKGQFKTFFSCGGCPEPEVIWTIRVTPDGIRDVGRRHTVPELQRCDELFDRIINHKSTRDIAAPKVVAALRGIVTGNFGMLSEWHVSMHNQRHVLDFMADEVEAGPWRFEMEERPRGLYIVSVTFARR